MQLIFSENYVIWVYGTKDFAAQSAIFTEGQRRRIPRHSGKNPPDFLKNLRIRLQSAEKYDILKKITPCHCRDKPNYTPNEKR